MTTTDVLKLDGRLIPSFKDKQTQKECIIGKTYGMLHYISKWIKTLEFLQGGRERRKKNQRDEGGVWLLTLSLPDQICNSP